MLLVLDDTTVFPIVFLGAQRIGAVPVPRQRARPGRQLRPLTSRTRTPTSWSPTPSALERLRAALGDRQLRYLVRGAEGPDVTELDQALAAQDDELAPAPDPPR